MQIYLVHAVGHKAKNVFYPLPLFLIWCGYVVAGVLLRDDLGTLFHVYKKVQAGLETIKPAMIPEEFYSVGEFYEDFEQVSDEEVMFYLDKLRELREAA